MTEQEIRADYRKITEKLIEKEKTITTMESCTSGLIASLITDTEGASAVPCPPPPQLRCWLLKFCGKINNKFKWSVQ